MSVVEPCNVFIDRTRNCHCEEDEKHHQNGGRDVDGVGIEGKLGWNDEKLTAENEPKPNCGIRIPLSKSRRLKVFADLLY